MGLGPTLFPISSTANAFAVWINSLENVGVGTSAPDGRLHVFSGSAGTVTAAVDFDDLVVENSGNTGISFLTPNTAIQQICFGDPEQPSGNYIRYYHNGDIMAFAAANVEFFRMVSSFRVAIGLSADGANAPDGSLHIFDGSAGSVAANADGDSLVLEDDTNCGMTILTPAANVGSIFFGSPTSATRGRVSYSHSTDTLNFATVATDRMDLSATALVPRTNDAMALGATGARWNNLFTVGASFTGVAIAFLNTSLGFFSTAAVVKQTSGADLTNNVTSGGTNDTIANYTSLATYSTDAAAIRNNIFQLARKLKQINDGLRAYGLFT